MKCIKCGAEIPEGNMYCAECGEEIHIVPDFEAEVESQIDETMNRIMDEMASQSDNDVPKKKKKHHYLLWIIVAVIVALAIGSYALWYLYTSDKYRIGRANYFVENGDYYKAIEYYEMVIDAETQDNIKLYWAVAKCYDNLNNYEQYEAYLFKILESPNAMQKDITLAYDYLFSLYWEKKDYQTIDSFLKDCNNVEVVEKYSGYMVSEPQFSHEAGYYKEIIPLKIKGAEGETVYYTTDGSVPTTESEVCKGLIFLGEGEHEIKAICVNKYGVISKVITKEYQIEL